MFEKIIGHENQKEILSNMIENNTISHSYLFSGKKGIGKASIAKEFASYILKTSNIDASPDFKYIKRQEDKKDILVEQIRKEVIDDMYISPISGDRKVYIIDDADSLNITAQNALLKTLEEPPRYVVIILVAFNESKFLPTILSRLTKISFQPLKLDELKKYMKEEYALDLSDTIVEFLDGSLGKAIEIVNKNLLEEFEKIDKLYEICCTKNEVKALLCCETIDFSVDCLLDYLEYILYKFGKYKTIEIVEYSKNRLKANGNYDIVIDHMILKIIENI